MYVLVCNQNYQKNSQYHYCDISDLFQRSKRLKKLKQSHKNTNLKLKFVLNRNYSNLKTTRTFNYIVPNV